LRKEITVSGLKLDFECNALTPILYKQEFQSDFYGDLLKMGKAFSGMGKNNDVINAKWEDLDHMDLTNLLQYAYVCAKTASKTDRKPISNYYKWVGKFNDLDIVGFSQVLELVMDSIDTKKK